MKQLPNTPPKGTSDWFPEEFKVRKHIFDTWRRVCLSYGFEEYLGPLVENIDIWKAKSGEDVGGTELTQITDREGKLSNLAIRPEMTPSVTRMVARKWKEIDKPVKWFSIANFYRNEKPQKGRNREFWQLNADVFGEDSLNADIEILSLTLDLMKAFSPPTGSYKLRINHRALINVFFDEVLSLSNNEQKKGLMRLLDKYDKLKKEDFERVLWELAITNIEKIHAFMAAQNISDLEKSFPEFSNNTVFQDFTIIFKTLVQSFGEEVVEFSASLIRWFDYYDGIIFEMFDTNPDNSRSLFGGWRYNGLASIFGVKESISALGFAPGDETMKLFLEGHGMLDDIISQKEELYYIPLLNDEYFSDIQSISQKLRAEGKDVLTALSKKKLNKAIQYANRKEFSHIVILWEQELENWEYTVKNLKTGEEENIKI